MMTMFRDRGLLGVLDAGVTMDELEDTLRRLALHDEGVIRAMLVDDLDDDALGIDAVTCALVRLSALAAIGAPVVAYQATVAQAQAAGATTDDILDALRVVATIVGGTRIVAAAPALALALGYDLDAMLEGYDPGGSGDRHHDHDRVESVVAVSARPGAHQPTGVVIDNHQVP
jgi:4-carboxymuconolactone decarboxylase